MIGYLEGIVLQYEAGGILLLSGNIGYEILLNPLMVEKIKTLGADKTPISLYIYYHQTDRQPKPVLIGFETIQEKQFFQTFITVDAIGPMKAAKAMTRPINEIAHAIEKKDVSFLVGLTGIGKRTAEKIIATLHGKVERYIGSITDTQPIEQQELSGTLPDIEQQVASVLVDQLGHSQASARRMIREALERNDTITTPEDLFDEIYQENR
ncbi:MAG: helix-hairpin-helix domain-containing protein [Desulfobacula sp.]|nr:helix-hairpin-helix domain-containing protein [Desulfobacula sp.]